MVEYLLYVTMVFVPIACWITYLLRQEEFAIKTTISVLVLSYLVIASFPLCMQYLGTSLTALTYCTVLVMLVVILFKPGAYTIGYQETFASAISRDSVRSSGDTAKTTHSTLPGKQEFVLMQEELSAPAIEICHEMPVLALTVPDPIIEHSTGADEQIPGVEPEASVDNIKESQADDLIKSWLDTDEITEGFDVQEAEVFQEQSEEKEDNHYNQVPDTVAATFPDLPIESGEIAVEPDNILPETELTDWIEQGFKAKAADDLEYAVNCFTSALESTSDNELKYLLGMELVNILQNIGDYTKAEDILDSLLELIDDHSPAIMEIKQQKQYMSLLASELDRLGMSGTPILEVPRFIRMKVNEKLLA